MANDNGDDDVGYKRPPKHTRFQPGRSGNAAGRRKHDRNFKTDLMEELREMIVIRENGRERKDLETTRVHQSPGCGRDQERRPRD